jgi:hypothetical protein
MQVVVVAAVIQLVVLEVPAVVVRDNLEPQMGLPELQTPEAEAVALETMLIQVVFLVEQAVLA